MDVEYAAGDYRYPPEHVLSPEKMADAYLRGHSIPKDTAFADALDQAWDRGAALDEFRGGKAAVIGAFIARAALSASNDLISPKGHAPT